MKTIKIIIVALLAVALNINSNAQGNSLKTSNIKTETLKVSGKCNMCKANIEKAAKTQGVSKAEWDSKAKSLSLSYDPSKTNIDHIGKKIADAGYDNEKAKADDKAYNALHSCCKYR